MNLKQLKNLINDLGLEALVYNVNVFYKKDEIFEIFLELQNLKSTEKNKHLLNIEFIKQEPQKFRTACLRWVEKAHENLRVPDLIEFSKHF